MSLPTVADVKDYLRIQHTAEDAMLGTWLTQVTARVEGFIRRPIIAEERTFVLPQPGDFYTRTPRAFFVPVYPVAALPLMTLTDNDAAELTVDVDYRINLETGEISWISGGDFGLFTVWPYTIVATVGLSAYVDYATRRELAISDAIVDLMADKYARRNPAATSEAAGGGVSTSYDVTSGLPTRVCDTLRPHRMARMG